MQIFDDLCKSTEISEIVLKTTYTNYVLSYALVSSEN